MAAVGRQAQERLIKGNSFALSGRGVTPPPLWDLHIRMERRRREWEGIKEVVYLLFAIQSFAE